MKSYTENTSDKLHNYNITDMNVWYDIINFPIFCEYRNLEYLQSTSFSAPVMKNVKHTSKWCQSTVCHTTLLHIYWGYRLGIVINGKWLL